MKINPQVMLEAGFFVRVRLLIYIFLTSPLGYLTETQISVFPIMNLPSYPDSLQVSSFSWVFTVSEWGQQSAIGLATHEGDSFFFYMFYVIIKSCPAYFS